MVLQEQEQRQAEAALGKAARAAMTGRATIRKQPGSRFALIEILAVCRAADQDQNGDKGEVAEPEFPQ